MTLKLYSINDGCDTFAEVHRHVYTVRCSPRMSYSNLILCCHQLWRPRNYISAITVHLTPPTFSLPRPSSFVSMFSLPAFKRRSFFSRTRENVFLTTPMPFLGTYLLYSNLPIWKFRTGIYVKVTVVTDQHFSSAQHFPYSLLEDHAYDQIRG